MSARGASSRSHIAVPQITDPEALRQSDHAESHDLGDDLDGSYEQGDWGGEEPAPSKAAPGRAKKSGGASASGFFQEHKFAIIVSVIVLLIVIVVLYVYLTRKGDRKRRGPAPPAAEPDPEDIEGLPPGDQEMPPQQYAKVAPPASQELEEMARLQATRSRRAKGAAAPAAAPPATPAPAAPPTRAQRAAPLAPAVAPPPPAAAPAPTAHKPRPAQPPAAKVLRPAAARPAGKPLSGIPEAAVEADPEEVPAKASKLEEAATVQVSQLIDGNDIDNMLNDIDVASASPLLLNGGAH